MRTALLRLAGILLGFAIFVVGYIGGYLLTLPDEPPQEPEPARGRFLQPDDPGFAEHLAQGCPGDVSWTPCALRLPDPVYTDGFTIEHDGITDVCRPADGTFTCTRE